MHCCYVVVFFGTVLDLNCYKCCKLQGFLRCWIKFNIFWIKFNTTRIKYNISCPARAYVILKCIVHMRILSELLWSSLGGSHGIPFINVELNSTEFEFNSTFQPCLRLYDFQIHWCGLALQRSATCTIDGLTTSGGPCVLICSGNAEFNSTNRTRGASLVNRIPI